MNFSVAPPFETQPLSGTCDTQSPPPVPPYMEEVYWWAYIHPRGIAFFDRPWLVNWILWGNFLRLRNAALEALGPQVSGRTLQIACVYGSFTDALVSNMTPGSWLDVVDIVPNQLANLRAKLPGSAPVTLHQNDAAALPFDDGTFDQIVLFFLLHEQPEDVRRQTLAEAWRTLRPGGRLVVMDYHRPAWWHPLRYLFPPVLRWLEPFALDLWRHELQTWLPASAARVAREERRFFGGLYQMAVLTR